MAKPLLFTIFYCRFTIVVDYFLVVLRALRG